MEMRVRQISSAAQDYVEPGFNFGHKPYSAFYEQHFGHRPLTGADGLALSVNWATIPGAVWQPRDQGGKGLCFSFASAGSVRSLNFIKTGEVYDPSTQQLIDCSTMSGGHCGGHPQDVLEYIINGGGVLTSDSYPSVENHEQEHCRRIKGHGIVIDDWKWVKPNCITSLKYAVNYMPVVVSIGLSRHMKLNGETLKFRQYEWGILHGPSCYTLDHSVLLVGYGIDIWGELFWLLLNSYGLFWGRGGFFQIAMANAQPGGTLGILREPLIPLKWSPNKMVVSRCESCPRCF